MRFMVIVGADRNSDAGVMPDEKLLAESEIKIRRIFEADDFGAEFTPELREQEERIRAQVAGK